MQSILKPFVLGLSLLAALPAIAQETTTETETDAEPAPPAGSTAADLSLGEPVNAETLAGLQPGAPYILEEFGDWALRCLKAPEGQNDPCQLYQLLLDADGNAVAEMSMFPLPPGGQAAAGATIVVPLETLLTQQLTLSVDGGQARRYPFTFCNAAGCVARVGFTADEIAQFKRGNAAKLRLVPAAAPDQEVLLDVSLTGFTAGFDGVVNVEE
ncbi:invasion associated locus B family protein [Yoonia sp. R2331]|uniref:invasion associated locus B family protein n=1 Tax=Yoonia sp. R2331 TaxID=3237238 RepID=UPI0034E53CBE